MDSLSVPCSLSCLIFHTCAPSLTCQLQCILSHQPLYINPSLPVHPCQNVSKPMPVTCLNLHVSDSNPKILNLFDYASDLQSR